MGQNESSSAAPGCDSSQLDASSSSAVEDKCPVSKEQRDAFLKKTGGISNQEQTAEQCPITPEQRDAMLRKAKERASELESPVSADNFMPVDPRQKPHPDQEFDLPTERTVSNIPRGGVEGDETWVYPSPQMFYNAVKRKGGDADQQAMSTVVNIHNGVNEATWRQIMTEWESMHDCKKVKLLRFRGRYNDLSPKARAKMLVGWKRPFDRHDWIVDRCGQEVRYIIDYYEEGKSNPEIGNLDIHLDIRPAIDSPGALVDRMRHIVS